MFLPSKRARTHTHTHAPTASFPDFIRGDRARVYQRRAQRLWIHTGISRPSKPIQSRLFAWTFIQFLSLHRFFFFLSVRTSAIWTRNCYFFPLSPPLTLLVSPVNYFPSLERRNYVSPPFARATCNTSSREFSIRLTIMFTRVTMDNSHAGI